MSVMKGPLNLGTGAAPRRMVPRARNTQAHIKPPAKRRLDFSIANRMKEDGAASKSPSEPTASVPSVHRRLALLGASVPCLCAACCGGGAHTAKAAGRSPLYDKYFAAAMRYAMDDYEALIRPIKTALFEELVASLLACGSDGDGAGSSTAAEGAMRVLEVGIGTGPNFPFYTSAISSWVTERQPEHVSLPEVVESLSKGRPGKPTPPVGTAARPGAEAGMGAHRPQPPLLRRLHIVGLDPNAEMLRYAAEAATAAGLRVSAVDAVERGDTRGSSNAGGSSTNSHGSRSGSGTAHIAGGDLASLVDVSLVSGSAESLPFGDGEFDAAVVTLVMCSVPSPATALSELRRVVRPTGRLLLIEHVAAEEGRPGLRLVQSLLTPLQRVLADGCCLNRDTAAVVHGAGWQGELRSFDVEGLSLLAPHIAGLLVA